MKNQITNRSLPFLEESSETRTILIRTIIALFILAAALAFASTSSQAQIPSITSFSPTSGAIGSSVTISGTGFNPTAAQNVVFFGATQALVTAASATSLTVTVPLGATYQYLSVTNLGVNLTAYSAKPFIVTLAGNIAFANKVEFATGTNPQSVSIGDLDGDGKSDLAVTNPPSNTISVLRNTSTIGNVSFATKVDFATSYGPISLNVRDIDGDGKPDLVVVNRGSHTVSVLRNTSTFGTLSFAAISDFATGIEPQSVSIGDIDGDGKPDLAVTNLNSNTVSVLRNTSTPGIVNFETKVDLLTGDYHYSVCIGDIDGDSKPDLAVTNSNSNSVSVLRNTSTTGTISFETKVDFATSNGPISVSIGDLDGDGKPELAVANYSSNTVSVLRNTSTSGIVSFATKGDFATGVNPYSVSIGDIDGDGSPDLAVANINSNTLSVLRNTSTSGAVSFATNVDFATSDSPNLVGIGDLDGDGKPDLAVATGGNSTVSILRQCTAPNIICPGNQTADASASCNAVVTYTETSTGTAPVAITYSFTGATTNSGTGTGSGSAFNKGTTTVTLTSTNACGNSSCSFYVVVTDVTPPTIICPTSLTVNANHTGCTYNGSIGAATATDNCGVANISGPVPAGPYPVGTTTVTWTATDAVGNTTNCTQDVIVAMFNLPPIANAGGPYILCPGSSLVLNATGSYDPNASCEDSIMYYNWDITGDGVDDIMMIGATTYTITWAQLQGYSGARTPGVHNIRLTVRDTYGIYSSQTTTYFVGPDATITGNSTFCAGSSTTLSIPTGAGLTYCWQNMATPASWQNIGTVGFSAGWSDFQSLAINNGIPYVAYQDNGNGAKTTVMKFNGTNWVNVGIAGFSAGFSEFQSLAFNNGTPYVAYKDGGSNGKTTVMKFDGSTWVNVGTAGFSAGDAYYQSLAFDGSTPYVAYADGANGSKVTVMKFDGSNWVTVGSAGFSAGQSSYQSLVFNGSIPYVAFEDAANGYKTTVMKFNGSAWVNVGTAGFSAGYASYQSMAFAGGMPYVAYQDWANGYKTTVMKFNGSDWVTVGTAGFSTSFSYNHSLAFNGSNPYVAYRDGANGDKTTVMKFDGGTWVTVGTAGFSASDTRFQSMAFNGGIPYVAYRDGTNGFRTTVMKFDIPCQSTSNNFIVNTAGTYLVNVTNTTGCSASSTVSVTESSLPTASCSHTDVSCSGGNDGTASVIASGGNGSYTYLWSDANSQTAATVTGLNAGVYTVTVTSNGCTATSSTTVETLVDVTPPTITCPTSLTVNANHAGCTYNGSIGAATATDNCGVANISGPVPAGPYPVGTTTVTWTATDAVGNTAICTQLVTVISPSINISSVITNIACKGSNSGNINLTTSGVNLPMSYLWNTGSTNEDMSNLFSGNYTVIVSDRFGCSATRSFNLTQPATVLTLSLSKINVRCFGKVTGKIDALPSGGNGSYLYLWSNGATTSGINSLAANIVYTLTVTDANGCSKTKSTVLTEGPAMYLLVIPDSPEPGNATASISQSPSNSPFAYIWNNGQTTNVATGLLPSRVYKVKVTDSKGCTTTGTISFSSRISNLTTETDFDISIYPNPTDGFINLVISCSNCDYFNVKIFNAVGEKLLDEKRNQNHLQFDLSNYKKGLYLFEVFIANERKTIRVVLE